jgi:hypothetical protein
MKIIILNKKLSLKLNRSFNDSFKIL